MPIAFTCPHCGHQTNVADQYAGMSGPCAQCGQTVTMPGAAWNAPPSGRRSTSTVLIVLLVVCGAAVIGCGLLAGLLLPAVQSARAAARRVQCSNNLRVIGLAMLQYESQYGSLPPAFVADKNGKPMHSWRVLILPFLERMDLYKRYNFDEPWDGPTNRKLLGQMPPQYHCISSDVPFEKRLTSYVVVVGKNTAFPGAKARELSELADGPARTLLVVEACHTGINWMEPRDLDLDAMNLRINDRDRPGIGSTHREGANAVFADGHIEMLPVNMPAAKLKSLADADDGKPD